MPFSMNSTQATDSPTPHPTPAVTLSAPYPARSGAPTEAYRVLMIAPTSFFADYGCHVRILEEARTLRKLGQHVTIATYHNGKDVDGLDIRRTLPIPWRSHYEVGSSRHKIAFDALLGLETLRLLARGRYDIIHAHLHEGALIGHVLGGLLRVPVVFDFQGSLTEEMIDHHFLSRTSRVYGPLRRLERWIDRTSRVILTSTTHAERVLVDDFDCAPERVQVLPDCVNADVFRPAAMFPADEQLALRRSLHIPDGHKVIVYLGLLAEYQGTDLLLEAFQRILAEHPNVFLLLMGFPGVEHYRRRAVALGIDHAVTLTGRIPYVDAPRYLALGDVAAGPKLSLTEGAGKLLNYMATGIPTVAFDTPVAREYLAQDGLLAVRGDVESLADQLTTALFPDADAAPSIRTMGDRLRRRVIQQYNWDQAGQVILDAYRSLRTPQAARRGEPSAPATR